ncbi:amidase signature domain-containing protein [Xylariales sp. PMI_506]|nr:amidase signature domain-containing protein [Xylariales sp. PMI_506]
MSATLAPEAISERNPITEEVVVSTLGSLGLKSDSKDLPDFTSLLTGIWEVWDKVDQMDDYIPEVDEARFPRNNNPKNAWAWKCDIRDTTSKSKGGLLDGKTVSFKDNIAVKGVPLLLGMDIFTDYIPNTDATVVTRGKAVCENLSAWGVSTSAATGPMSNIWAEGFSAGGSSSGSSILVGTGACWGSMGGDQGGSIRVPSTANGIVGLKPTTGLVPYTRIASLAAVLDYTGPMTKTVLDNALLLQAVAGYHGIDDRAGPGCPLPGQVPDYPARAQQGVQGMKIGILTEGFDQPLCDERVSALVTEAAKALEKLGCIVEEVSYPGRIAIYTELVGLTEGRRGYSMNDLLDKIHPIMQDKFDKMWVSHQNAIINGKWGAENLPPSQTGKASNLVRKLKDEYYRALDKYDVLITPTMPMLPPKLPAAGSTIREYMTNSIGVSLNTSAFNLTGMPALSLPVGFLPSLIVSKFYEEATIYRVAHAWEQAFDWKTFE